MSCLSSEIVIESILNHIDIREIEECFPDRHIPLLPIGMYYRYDNDKYVVHDNKTTYYSGQNIHYALKALERLQGTIIYSKIIKQK